MTFSFLTRRRNTQFLPIQGSDKLLANGTNPKSVESIRQSVGINDRYFQYYHAALSRAALLTQLCPASESHHHAWPGGLLAHILESCAHALRLRKGRILPAGATPEEEARSRDVYTYAVFSAALLHDIAKPLTDQRISLYNWRGKSLGEWDPLSQDLTAFPGARSMQIEFRNNRNYGHHQVSALIYISRILPARGFQWIREDPVLYSHFLATFSSDPTGPIYDLASKGDQVSVSRALGARGLTRFTPGERPLWMKIRTALRHLIEKGELPLNRPGAAGWVSRDSVWLVSKRTADSIRRTLEAEGQGGIPHDNNRIFDILVESGLLVPTEDGKAIWRCTISKGEWEQSFTLLQVPNDMLWNNPGDIELFEGSIQVEETTSIDQNAEKEPTKGTVIRVVSQPMDSMASSDDDSFIKDPSEGIGIKEDLDASNGPVEDEKQEKDGAGSVPSADATESLGLQFKRWLETGINEQTQPVNRATAVIHFLEQGVFLVSPRIFKMFGEEFSVPWEDVQKAFQQLGIHTKNPYEGNDNWWQVRIQKEGKISTMRGWCIPLEALDLTVSQKPNELLTLIEKTTANRAGGRKWG